MEGKTAVELPQLRDKSYWLSNIGKKLSHMLGFSISVSCKFGKKNAWMSNYKLHGHSVASIFL